MLSYIRNLIPRLNQFSKNLDSIEIFVDKPWVLVDDGLNIHEYFFQRDGKLTSSINSKVVQGRWELVGGSERLLIDNGPEEKTLFQHIIFVEGLFVLRRSGTTEDPFILYDRKVIPDGNVFKYLVDYLKKHGIVLDNEGNPFTGIQISNGDERLHYKIENGEVVGKYYIVNYNTESGKIKIKQRSLPNPLRGDIILNDNDNLSLQSSHGVKYFLSDWKIYDSKYEDNYYPRCIIVSNNIVTDVKFGWIQDNLFLIYPFVILCILLIVYAFSFFKHY